MNTDITYEEAMAQLEDITRKMESGALPIHQMASQVKKAQELLAFCKQQLLTTEEEINQMLAN